MNDFLILNKIFLESHIEICSQVHCASFGTEWVRYSSNIALGIERGKIDNSSFSKENIAKSHHNRALTRGKEMLD